MTRHRNDGLRKRCRCPRRQWAKCGHPWHLNFKWGGVHYRVSVDRYVGHHVGGGKTAARQAADRIREEIRSGTFVATSDPRPATPDAVTLSVYGAIFLERYTKARGKASWRNDVYMLKRICTFSLPDGSFGEKPIGAVTEDDIEAFLTHLREQGRAASTRNQYLQIFKAMSGWGVRKGHLTRPWIGPNTDLRREKIARRNRRLQPGEEQQLLTVAHPRLYRLIVAALEIGSRLGELLALRWREVDLGRRELRLLAETTKDDEDRILPLSSRLLAVLQMAQTDPSGEPFGPDAYVFGDAAGQRVKSVKKPWQTAVLKAHGHTLEDGKVWKRGRLVPELQAAYEAIITLHFHDLRHEAGSRLLELGRPLHHVQEMLGHADIKTTDTYLNVTRIGLHDSMKRFERHIDDSGTSNPVSVSPEERPGPDLKQRVN